MLTDNYKSLTQTKRNQILRYIKWFRNLTRIQKIKFRICTTIDSIRAKYVFRKCLKEMKNYKDPKVPEKLYVIRKYNNDFLAVASKNFARIFCKAHHTYYYEAYTKSPNFQLINFANYEYLNIKNPSTDMTTWIQHDTTKHYLDKRLTKVDNIIVRWCRNISDIYSTNQKFKNIWTKNWIFKKCKTFKHFTPSWIVNIKEEKTTELKSDTIKINESV